MGREERFALQGWGDARARRGAAVARHHRAWAKGPGVREQGPKGILIKAQPYPGKGGAYRALISGVVAWQVMANAAVADGGVRGPAGPLVREGGGVLGFRGAPGGATEA